MISFQDVEVKQQGNILLQDINWHVDAKEHWALIGMNGAGKTTLLKLLNGYMWPTKGEIAVFQQPLGTVPVQVMRQRIGWVSDDLTARFQNKQNETALAIVLSGFFGSVGLFEQTDDYQLAQAEKALDDLKVLHKADEPLYRLSQGEKQRVLIARARCFSPDILIFDEPMTGMDVRGREDMVAAVDALARVEDGPTIIYVTHHIEEIAPSINKTAVLQNGNITHCGGKEHVLTSPILSEVFDVSVNVHWAAQRPWLIRDEEGMQ
ncbi:iron complex transport system ATP-binding protein [Salsuginibacillus halophilus]|uniref:Iron complex transport system ATP-binding protein n=1 Tax=Salsuginibacillus halophilus TaxID=517424 RepID=A0A2P8HYT4_9BACI|nr:ATP-binding cassette domain-containing protein [Salsuginibacillus halophilus]PSL51345.1 iron complex transport system ATP-binding protein [Salsuginibacillus halophilus]